MGVCKICHIYKLDFTAHFVKYIITTSVVIIYLADYSSGNSSFSCFERTVGVGFLPVSSESGDAI